jgi:hypothetical protein
MVPALAAQNEVRLPCSYHSFKNSFRGSVHNHKALSYTYHETSLAEPFFPLTRRRRCSGHPFLLPFLSTFGHPLRRFGEPSQLWDLEIIVPGKTVVKGVDTNTPEPDRRFCKRYVSASRKNEMGLAHQQPTPCMPPPISK